LAVIIKPLKDPSCRAPLHIGAGGDAFSHRSLFGLLNDILIETVDCSTLIVRHYQPEAVTWLNKCIHQVEV
jgi:hypothetical protein